MKRSCLVLNEEERIREKKKGKLTESFHLTVEMTRRSNYVLSINLRKLRTNKVAAETVHKAAVNEKRTDSRRQRLSKTPRRLARHAIRLISNDNPAKISHSYT